jgi:pSer/pThr/pTyr-binding forkhead associated (FHA) protein
MKMNMATLYHIAENGSRLERWEISEEPVIVGRDRQVKVNIEDEGVSRRHFIIVRDGEAYVIKDLNSRNGTWVAGHRVVADKLHDNDCILAGHTRFLFADRPGSSTTTGKDLAGSHGTVVISAPPAGDRGSSEPVFWQCGPGDEDRAALKPPGEV